MTKCSECTVCTQAEEKVCINIIYKQNEVGVSLWACEIMRKSGSTIKCSRLMHIR